MGQRIPPVPHIYGDDCLLCFDADKTPKYVFARFSEIEKCVIGDPDVCVIPPNDRLFKLTQVEGTPCRWTYDEEDWFITYWKGGGIGGEDELHLLSGGGLGYFRGVDAQCSPEGTVFHNTWPPCNGMFCGHGGMGVVTWTQQATELLAAINMERSDNLFLELFPLIDGNLIYKFCRLQDATNIAIEFEPD